MKQIKLLLLLRLTLLCICYIFAGILVRSQNVDLSRYQKIKPVAKKRVSSALPAKKFITQYITSVRERVVQPTSLSITTEPGADLTIESISSKKKRISKADSFGTALFTKIDGGKYNVYSSLEGFKVGKAETTIMANKTAIIHIPLKRLTYDLPITTNVENGEIRYAPLKKEGQNSDGTPKLVTAGGYCVVMIENKKAVIKKLTEGYYTLDVSSPKAPEYETKYVQIQITEDLLSEENADDTDENPPTEIILPNRQSTGTFTLSKTWEDWELSTEKWKIDIKGLTVEGAGIALPLADSYRFYKDFEMHSTVRLLNDTSIGFAIRAENEKNFYLIKLTGSEDKNKYLVSASIIENGKEIERVLSLDIGFLLKDVLSNHKYFDVVIKGKGNEFKIFAEDGTGKLKELGNAHFKADKFPIGAVGFFGDENSSFEVARFSVCNKICR